MGRELSLSRRRKKGLSKSGEPPREGKTKRRGDKLVTYCSPPCFVKTALFTVYISLERCFSNDRIRHTDTNLVFSSRGRSSAYVYANLYFDVEDGEKQWAVMAARL